MKSCAFNKVIGYDKIVKELEKISDALKNTTTYMALGAHIPHGLLLHGTAGVGKTLMANCLIEDCGRQVFLISKSNASGNFSEHIRTVFAQAADNEPSIVFMDDVDKFANDDRQNRNAEEFVTIQSCMDASKDRDVFVLATANDMSLLPRSLVRAGRFDNIFEVCTPTGKDAENIVDYYLSGKKCVGDIDIKSLSRLLEGYSCATLETIINEAAVRAAYNRRDRVSNEDVVEACLKVVWDIPENSDTDSLLNEETARTAFHEAGHAVISEMLLPECLTLMCIRAEEGKRGFVSYARSSIKHDIDSQEAQIIRSLGGKAAVELKYGIVDEGCTRDIENAVSAVADMLGNICSRGFTHKCHFEGETDSFQNNQNAVISAEVERLYQKAKRILIENWDMVDAFATALLDKKVLTVTNINAIKEEVLASRKAAE